MSTRRRWIGMVLAVAIFAMVVTGSVLQAIAPAEAAEGLTVGDRVAPFSFALMSVVGATVTWRRPDHVFGWLMVAFAVMMSVSSLTTSIVHVAPSDSTVMAIAAWFGSWSWVPGIILLAIGLLVFPDGKLPSRRWRHVLRVELIGLCLSGALAVTLWPYRGPELAEVEDQWPGLAGAIGGLTLPVVFIGFFAALVSLVARYRSATMIVRLQLKWLILAVTLLVGGLATAAIVDLVGVEDQWLQDIFGTIGLLFLPIAIGFAVLKYRLFEIDRILSRTVSHLALTAVLVGVYALGVVGIGALVPGQRSDLLVAGSTLAVAALFRPLRSRIQAVVDRRFNRASYDAAQTLQAFGARLRDEVDLETLRGEMADLAATTFQPRIAGVWLPGEATT